MTNRTPEEIARGLTEAQREFVRIGATQGLGQYPAEIGQLNAAELVHIDALKGSGGLLRWKSRLTPLGLAVRSHLESHPK